MTLKKNCRILHPSTNSLEYFRLDNIVTLPRNHKESHKNGLHRRLVLLIHMLWIKSILDAIIYTLKNLKTIKYIEQWIISDHFEIYRLFGKNIGTHESQRSNRVYLYFLDKLVLICAQRFHRLAPMSNNFHFIKRIIDYMTQKTIKKGNIKTRLPSIFTT